MDAEVFVYVIRAVESGRVKIGSARNPARRLRDLQIGSPEHLELVCAFPGGRELELRLHAELESDRLHGEWFHLSDRAVFLIGNQLGWDRQTPQQLESARKAAELRSKLDA